MVYSTGTLLCFSLSRLVTQICGLEAPLSFPEAAGTRFPVTCKANHCMSSEQHMAAMALQSPSITVSFCYPSLNLGYFLTFVMKLLV